MSDPFGKIMQTLDHNHIQRCNYDSAMHNRFNHTMEIIHDKINTHRREGSLSGAIRVIPNNAQRVTDDPSFVPFNRKRKYANKRRKINFSLDAGNTHKNSTSVNNRDIAGPKKTDNRKDSRVPPRKKVVDAPEIPEEEIPSWIVYPNNQEVDYLMPESRHSATFTLTTRNSAVLLGGVSNEYTHDIWTYTFNNRLWKKTKMDN